MLNIASGFKVLSPVPLDSRTILSRSEMLTMNDNLMAEYFLSQCSDDNGKLYIYNKNATPNPTTGKFTPLEDSFGQDIQVDTLPIAGSDNVDKVYQYIGTDDDVNNLKQGCWYICKGDDVNGYAWENILVEPALTLTEIVDELDPNFVAGSLKTIVLKQGDTLIGKFGIDKELVVTSGSVQKITVEKVDEGDPESWIYTLVGTTPTETYSKADTEDDTNTYYKYPLTDGTFIKLAIANQTYPIFVDVKDIASDTGTTTEDITANVEVGGIEIGDVLPEGTGINTLVKKLLIKYYPPTITLSATPTNKIVEIGETVNVELSAVCTKRSKDITSVSFYNDTTSEQLEEVTSGVDAGGTFTHEVVNAVTSNTTFKAYVTDGDKTVENAVTYKFVNPYYVGVSATNVVDDIDMTTLTKKIEEQGKKSITYTGNNEYTVFAYDATYPDLTSILDPSSFENITSWTKTEKLVGTTNYKVYVSNTPITTTGFKYTFIY